MTDLTCTAAELALQLGSPMQKQLSALPSPVYTCRSFTGLSCVEAVQSSALRITWHASSSQHFAACFALVPTLHSTDAHALNALSTVKQDMSYISRAIPQAVSVAIAST